MTASCFPPAAALSAGDAAEDDGEEGEDGVENGLADGDDAVHNGHDAAGNGVEQRLDLRQKNKVSVVLTKSFRFFSSFVLSKPWSE